MSEQIAARYRRFAEVEAHGRSQLYETFALGVAADACRAAIPRTAAGGKAPAQPAVRRAAPRLRHARDWPAFRALLHEHAAAVRATMLAHRHADQ